MTKNQIIEKLKKAILEQDPALVETAIFQIHKSNYEKEYIPLLIELLDADWHVRHEDIVLAFQDFKDNDSTAILLKTAKRKFEYLDYDNSYALARKCTWALAEIATIESKNALLEISQMPDNTIANFAIKRLDNWKTI